MTVTAADIVAFLEEEGQLVRLAGAPRETAAGVVVNAVNTHLGAGGGDIAWTRCLEEAAQFSGALLLSGEAGLKQAAGPDEARAAAEAVSGPAAATAEHGAGDARPVAICRNPRLAMALVVQRFFAHLADDREAEFGDPRVAALVAHNRAWVRNAAVGANVVIGPLAVIGCSGMGFERDSQGRLVRFPQLGDVVIADDVDVAAHASVQRGSIGPTVLRRGAKIGPHVNVGHNVVVGEDVLVAGHAQIGGSASIGARAVIWQGATIANGVKVGDGATVGMSAAVRKDIGPERCGPATRPAGSVDQLRERPRGGSHVSIDRFANVLVTSRRTPTTASSAAAAPWHGSSKTAPGSPTPPSARPPRACPKASPRMCSSTRCGPPRRCSASPRMI